MADPLPVADIKSALSGLEGWTYKDDCLFAEIEFNDFKEAMSFLVYVGLVAEAANHHPEIQNIYNRVRLALSTHDAGNKVTQRDVDLARQIQGMLEG